MTAETSNARQQGQAVAWRVPVLQSPFGERLDHGVRDELVLVMHRGTHGWKAAGQGHARLARQIYVKDVEPLCAASYEVAVVGLSGGGWRTVWARSDDDVTHPAPQSTPPAEEQLTYKGVPIGPMQTFADIERQAIASAGAAEDMVLDAIERRESSAPVGAEAKAVPVPTRVHLIGETAVIVGTPGRGWDEDAQDAHSCDAMGCATIGPHVLARVPFTDERALPTQQGGGEINMDVTVRDGAWVGTYAEWCRRKQAAPPSAPVVGGLIEAAKAAESMLRTVHECASHDCEDCREHAGIHAKHLRDALAQQPAAPTWIGIDWAAGQKPAAGVGEEIMVSTPYDVFTLPLRPSGLDGKGPRFVVNVPGPEQPAAAKGAEVEALRSEAAEAAKVLRGALDARTDGEPLRVLANRASNALYWRTESAERAKARAERLAEALRNSADALERLAFAIRAPNAHTPQLVELAIAMRAAAQPGGSDNVRWR